LLSIFGIDFEFDIIMHMKAYAYPKIRKNRESILEQVLLTLLMGFVLFFVLLVFVFAGFQVIYAGRIFPGVTVAGIEVGGLSQSSAAARISDKLSYPQTGKILLQSTVRTWSFSPVGLGLFLDPEASARKALEIGRSGSLPQRIEEQFQTTFSGRPVAPNLVLDERMAQKQISVIAEQIDQPVSEPSLTLHGTEVVINPGQTGRTVDIPTTLAALREPLHYMRDAVVPLVMTETSPLISDVSAQADEARRILSEPLKLRLADDQPDAPGPWTLSPEELAPMLTFERIQDGGHPIYQVALNRVFIYAYLSKLATAIQKQPQNARFTFNDESHQLEVLEKSVTGRQLDIPKTFDHIQEELTKGSHEIQLELLLTPPAVTDQMSGDQLGIRELVHAETSYFYGSSAERVQNITASAKQFHGMLVAPGETFSMASALGDISLDNGYAEALIILGDRTIKGVGGGVCQVSTTLFRAAFFAGFPIVERHAHAYRVYYYEKVAGNRINPDLAGLDATVYAPLVDFKFRNDTPNWLLMETYVNPQNSSITWKFYATKDGRSVDWNTTGPTNVIEAPKDLYRENPDLPQGEVKQVDWPAEGADITVDRTVNKDGKVYLQDTFQTHYLPWQAVYEYGPGTEGMPPAENGQ
jgi:vancomycin resistance protein YoaR